MLAEDPQLLRRFKEGDREALTAVYNHYSSILSTFLFYGFAFRSGGHLRRFKGLKDRHDLHDLLAETFRKAFEQRARLSYSGTTPYIAYLRTIARNLIIDRLRSKGSRWQSFDETVAPRELDDLKTPQIETRYQSAELSRTISGFIAQQPTSVQRFIELRYQEGLSQRDVAQQMHKTRRWVRSVEIKVRRSLTQYLRARGYLLSTDWR